MGNFANNAITDVGRMLLADVQYGAIFTPTRIVIGSGSMPSGATAQGMTDVITPVKSLVINKKKRTPDGKCVFGGVYTNEEVTAPFYFRELALYAKAVYLNADGSVKSEGAETLYSYGNAGTTADYMPAYSSSTVVEKQIDLVAWVGNDAQVDLSIESGIYITHGDFDSHAARHAAGGDDPITPESIGAAPAGYGLGGYPQKTISLAELDSVFNTGWYWLSQPGSTLSGVGFNYANVLVHGIEPTSCTQELRPLATNIVLRRRCHLNSWGEWEVENPPFAPGVQYRTTEQRNHKSVFKSLGTDGVLRYRLDGETAWKTYAQEIGAVSRTGDTINGPLYFNNPNDYFAIRKGRVLSSGQTHFLTVGVGATGSATLEHYTGDGADFSTARLDGRLELNAVTVDGNPSSTALLLRKNGEGGAAYRIYGDHYSPAVVATAELI